MVTALVMVRWRDKTQIYALSHSIGGAQFIPELAKIRFGFDISQARTGSNQASAQIHSKTYMLSASRSFALWIVSDKPHG